MYHRASQKKRNPGAIVRKSMHQGSGRGREEESGTEGEEERNGVFWFGTELEKKHARAETLHLVGILTD